MGWEKHWGDGGGGGAGGGIEIRMSKCPGWKKFEILISRVGRLLGTKEWAHLFYYYYFSFSCNNIKNLTTKFLLSDEVLSQRSVFISIILLFYSDTTETV